MNRFFKDKLANCVICRQPLSGDTQLVCIHCKHDQLRIYYPGSLPSLIHIPTIEANTHCNYVDQVFAVVPYVPPYTDFIQTLKFGRQLLLGRLMGNMLVDWLDANQVTEPSGILVPMPIHFLRFMRRGYNQSQLIAKEVAAQRGYPIGENILSKCRYTSPQAQAKRQSRFRMRHSFASRRLNGETIILIDDVITTGHTANEAARTLKKAGAGRVCLWVFACANDRIHDYCFRI
ncbi:ComF family protein [Algicola sagamiensis]|uniref:ComF family protein n=1 Tax=Algicola sagamiensis TaxID=163869 RepID=UPI000362A040|nr:phosphoribosyltransferase family protein [Algicola sagamiensis]